MNVKKDGTANNNDQYRLNKKSRIILGVEDVNYERADYMLTPELEEKGYCFNLRSALGLYPSSEKKHQDPESRRARDYETLQNKFLTSYYSRYTVLKEAIENFGKQFQEMMSDLKWRQSQIGAINCARQDKTIYSVSSAIPLTSSLFESNERPKEGQTRKNVKYLSVSFFL